MDSQTVSDAIDNAIDSGLDWLNTNGAPAFDAIRLVLDHVYGAIAWLLQSPPFPIVVVAVALLGWRTVGPRFAVAAAIGLACCAAIGLWPETMATLALIATATALALVIAIPLGILAG